MEDIDLPVWTIRPNWRTPLLERLGWLTDVLPSNYGPEQRTALRLSPRRSFEIAFNPVGQVRTYFDLWLHRMAADEFMLPLFHDKGKLSAAVEADDTLIPVDTTYREFEAGGLAIIMGDNPFVYDKLEIISVANDGLTVEAPGVTSDWPKGAAIYPLRRTHLSEESALSALSSRVGQASLLFELNQANDIPDEGEWNTLFQDIPVMTTKPNWRDSRDMSFIRNMLVLDNDHGLKTRQDDAGRAFTMQVHNHMMRGRLQHWQFRQLAYRLRGQQSPIWLPTFNDDIELAAAHVAANSVLNIKRIGYLETGGVTSGRHNLILDGSIMRAISGSAVGLSATEERLLISGSLGVDLPSGTKGCFMEPCRLSGDEVEIVHHTDTDGVAECNLSFRSFRDEREEDSNIDNPIPAATQRTEPCGDLPEPTGDRAVSIVIDKSSGMRFPTMDRFNTIREAMIQFLDTFVRAKVVEDGELMDFELRYFWSTTAALVYRPLTAANIDEMIASLTAQFINTVQVADWRPGALGAKGFFDGSDPAKPRQLYWLSQGSASWDFMGTDGAATINSITPAPLVNTFSMDVTNHAALIDNTADDGLPYIFVGDVPDLLSKLIDAWSI